VILSWFSAHYTQQPAPFEIRFPHGTQAPCKVYLWQGTVI